MSSFLFNSTVDSLSFIVSVQCIVIIVTMLRFGAQISVRALHDITSKIIFSLVRCALCMFMGYLCNFCLFRCYYYYYYYRCCCFCFCRRCRRFRYVFTWISEFVLLSKDLNEKENKTRKKSTVGKY